MNNLKVKPPVIAYDSSLEVNKRFSSFPDAIKQDWAAEIKKRKENLQKVMKRVYENSRY